MFDCQKIKCKYYFYHAMKIAVVIDPPKVYLAAIPELFVLVEAALAQTQITESLLQMWMNMVIFQFFGGNWLFLLVQLIWFAWLDMCSISTLWSNPNLLRIEGGGCYRWRCINVTMCNKLTTVHNNISLQCIQAS